MPSFKTYFDEQPVDPTPDVDGDYLLEYDTSAGQDKKVLMSALRTSMFSGGEINGGALTSFELPNSLAPSLDANGEIALDTSVDDFSHGVLKYYGGEILALIAVPLAELSGLNNGDVVAYNATNDEFEITTHDLTTLGVTASAAELNILDGATLSVAELNTLDGLLASTAELNTLDGITASTAELNILAGVTASTAELNLLDGVTASTAELNLLDGVTASTAELNYVGGVTSNIQTQLDGKALSRPTINAQTGTTYTVLTSDNGNIVTLNNASPVTVTVPSGLGVGFHCQLIQKGAGQATFSASSTTINNRQGHNKTAGQHSIVTLEADVADNFYLGGDTSV